ADVDYLIILNGTRAAQPCLEPAGKLQAFAALSKHMILGLGLPQIAELLLPRNLRQAATLLKIAASRTLAALALAGHARCYRLTGGCSPAQTADLLAEFLKK
ncbi:MAG TPA: hypothetical protein PLL10_06115, partial [Elusimicrobiales bacterium]|nr:hypothetical protein [Elusimicrobiales bacterium]